MIVWSSERSEITDTTETYSLITNGQQVSTTTYPQYTVTVDGMSAGYATHLETAVSMAEGIEATMTSEEARAIQEHRNEQPTA